MSCCPGPSQSQKCRKGVGGQRGWHEEILPVPEIQTSFLCPFPMPPLGEGERNSGDQFSLYFGTPPTLGLFGGNSGKMPERPRKRTQSFFSGVPLESAAGIPPKPYDSRHLKPPEHFQNSLPPQYVWGRPLCFQKWFRRGPLRTGHGIPSSTKASLITWSKNLISCPAPTQRALRGILMPRGKN